MIAVRCIVGAAARALGAILLIVTVLMALPVAPASAQQQTLRLYPGAAPGSETWTYPETVQRGERADIVTNVRDPEISVYLPDPTRANGAAVIVLPGGALRLLAIGQEARDITRRFNERGIAVIVLKYRTLQVDPAAPRAAPPMSYSNVEIRNANANPDPNNAALTNVLHLAIADAQTALRLVRAHAEEWRIDPNRIGMIGSSAGGGVAIGALLARATDAMPNFLISLYGPALQDVAVPADAPPIFLATESGHQPVTDGLLALFSIWKRAGKPAELHVFETPSLFTQSSLWIDRALPWMEEQRILQPASQPN